MRTRVALQRVVRSADAGGGAAEMLETFATVWAEVAGRRAGSEEAAGRRLELLRARLTIWARADIDLETRAALDGRRWRVTSVADPDGRGRFLNLDIEEERR